MITKTCSNCHSYIDIHSLEKSLRRGQRKFRILCHSCGKGLIKSYKSLAEMFDVSNTVAK